MLDRNNNMQVSQVDAGLVGKKLDKGSLSSAEIRESMVRLPKWAQGFLTWLTTQPMPNQVYKPRSGKYQVLTGFLSVIFGVVMSALLLKLGKLYYVFFVVSLAVTVSGMRKLQVVIYHHCSHGSVFESRWANHVLGEVLSVILVLKDFRTYKRDHMAHHNAKKLLTYEDETVQDLGEIGLLPGVTKNILWIRLMFSFISPIAHARWLLNRVRNCFLSLNILHNMAAITIWFGLIFIVNYHHLWSQFLIIWLFPLTVLYHISRILRLVAEHRWPDSEVLNSRGKMFICLSTVAVFNGEALQEKAKNEVDNFFSLVWWSIKMMAHLFARVFVLVGDTPCHDYHHRRPSSREWVNYAFAREQDKEKNCPGYPLNYSEIWGLFNAINQNFKSLSEVK